MSMSFMVGSEGRFSSRLHRINVIRLKHLGLLMKTPRNDTSYGRRLKMKHRLDMVYSEIRQRIYLGQLDAHDPKWDVFQCKKIRV